MHLILRYKHLLSNREQNLLLYGKNKGSGKTQLLEKLVHILQKKYSEILIFRCGNFAQSFTSYVTHGCYVVNIISDTNILGSH